MSNQLPGGRRSDDLREQQFRDNTQQFKYTSKEDQPIVSLIYILGFIGAICGGYYGYGQALSNSIRDVLGTVLTFAMMGGLIGFIGGAIAVALIMVFWPLVLILIIAGIITWLAQLFKQ